MEARDGGLAPPWRGRPRRLKGPPDGHELREQEVLPVDVLVVLAAGDLGQVDDAGRNLRLGEFGPTSHLGQ